MPTQTVEFRAAPGLTLTAKLFTAGSDTVVQTASAVTEATNRKGTYAATFTDPGAAEFELIALSGTTPVARWFCTLTLTTATFQAYEVRTAAVVARVTANTDQWGGVTVTGMPMPTYTQPTGFLAATFPTTVSSFAGGAVASVSGSVGSIAGVTFPTNFSTLGINSSGHLSRVTLVDTTTTNTDMRGTDGAALASAWTATRAGYLDSVVLAANNNQRTVQITGSQHIAADVHEMQTDVIDADAIAASAVTELQAGLATAANLLIVSDRVSYSLAVLVGACSDAQTAAETYTLTIGGNTFTVDYTGLDSSGNRSTTTLSKT